MNVPAIFICCFAAFGITGFVLQADEQNTGSYVPRSVIDTISIERNNQSIFIHVNCRDGRPIGRYNIAEDNVEISPAEYIQAGAMLEDFVFGLPKDIVFGFIGGAGGGLSIVKIAQAATEASSRKWYHRANQVAAAVIGTVSGYKVGVYLARQFEPTCGSERFQKRLLDKKFWIGVKRTAILTMWVSYKNCDAYFAAREGDKLGLKGEIIDASDIEHFRQTSQNLQWITLDDDSVRNFPYEKFSRIMLLSKSCSLMLGQ